MRSIRCWTLKVVAAYKQLHLVITTLRDACSSSAVQYFTLKAITSRTGLSTVFRLRSYYETCMRRKDGSSTPFDWGVR